MSRRSYATTAFVGAALVGVAGGWLMAQRHDRAHRHHLFSSHAWRRHAALGWIGSEGDVDLLPLLRDYVAWEPLPALQQRARRIIASLEAMA